MKAFKRYMALALVFALLVTGSILLMVECDTIKGTWLSCMGAFLCFGIALILGYIFDRKKLLPE